GDLSDAGCGLREERQQHGSDRRLRKLPAPGSERLACARGQIDCRSVEVRKTLRTISIILECASCPAARVTKKAASRRRAPNHLLKSAITSTKFSGYSAGGKCPQLRNTI